MHQRIVLITGASSGLGKAAARQFAQQGDLVIVSDRQVALGEATTAEIRAEGGEAVFIAADVTDAEAVACLFAKIKADYGRLTVAVNNAGIGGSGLTPTHAYPMDVYAQVMDVNVTGVLRCLQAELGMMLAQGHGSIVNVASAAGLIGMPNNAAYCAAKHAVVGLTRTAALEYARKNIRVNAVCPAFTYTPMVEQLIQLRTDMEQRLIQSIPMQRLGQPTEIAEAIVWLCSEKASFVTGQAFALDGGLTAA